MTDLPKTCQSVADVAKFLRLSEQTVRRLIKTGKLKVLRIGRRVIITPAALATFLEESERVEAAQTERKPLGRRRRRFTSSGSPTCRSTSWPKRRPPTG